MVTVPQEIGLPKDHSFWAFLLSSLSPLRESIDLISLVWVFSHFNSKREKVLMSSDSMEENSLALISKVVTST